MRAVMGYATHSKGSALTETVCGCQGKLLGSSVHGGVATSEPHP